MHLSIAFSILLSAALPFKEGLVLLCIVECLPCRTHCRCMCGLSLRTATELCRMWTLEQCCCRPALPCLHSIDKLNWFLHIPVIMGSATGLTGTSSHHEKVMCKIHSEPTQFPRSLTTSNRTQVAPLFCLFQGDQACSSHEAWSSGLWSLEAFRGVFGLSR